METSSKRTLAIIGASILMVGLFLPLISLLGFVNWSYFDLVTKVSARFATGLLIFALGVFSLVLALKNNFKPLIWTGILALAVLAFDFLTYKRALMGMMPEGTRSTGMGRSSVEFNGAISELAGMVIQPGWGIFAMAAGAILLIVAGAAKEKAPLSTDWDRHPPPPPMNYS